MSLIYIFKNNTPQHTLSAKNPLPTLPSLEDVYKLEQIIKKLIHEIQIFDLQVDSHQAEANAEAKMPDITYNRSLIFGTFK